MVLPCRCRNPLHPFQLIIAMKQHFLILCFCVLLLSGCGNGQVSVKGTVQFPDGTPLTRGDVQFLTPTFVGSGQIQPDGSYVIGSLKEADGLPKGTYTITVRAYEDQGNTAGISPENVKPVQPLVDLKYSSPQTSGLTCDVQGPTVHLITVEPFKK